MSYVGGRIVAEIALGSDFCEEERGAILAKLPERREKTLFGSRRAAEEIAGRK
jgi:hypothetical protein